MIPPLGLVICQKFHDFVRAMRIRPAIPWVLVLSRALMAPVLVIVALSHGNARIVFGVILVAGVLSDIFDGILARRWNCATSRLRVADSAVDTVFYIGVAAAILIRFPGVIWRNLSLLLILVALELLRHGFDFIRFRKMASYHSWFSKAWGLLLLAASVSLLCLGRFPFLISLALVWGIVCDLEGLAISMVLPAWQPDIRTLGRAWAVRREAEARKFSLR